MTSGLIFGPELTVTCDLPPCCRPRHYFFFWQPQPRKFQIVCCVVTATATPIKCMSHTLCRNKLLVSVQPPLTLNFATHNTSHTKKHTHTRRKRVRSNPGPDPNNQVLISTQPSRADPIIRLRLRSRYILCA